MALPTSAAVVVTALVVGALYHRSLRTTMAPTSGARATVLGVGLLAVAVATVFVLVLHAPALPVAAVGLAAVLLRWRRGAGRRPCRPGPRWTSSGRPGPTLGLAVALGTLGRSWSGPDRLLLHFDAGGTAAVAALSRVLVNNLPAASLLAARQPPPPLRAPRRAERGAEPVRDGLAGLVPVAPRRQGGRRAPRLGTPACSGWPAGRSPWRPRSACWS